MTGGLRRLHQSKQSHFVTFSSYRRGQKLVSPEICQLFVERLEAMRCRFQSRVYGFVVMPEHAHLLLSEPYRGNLAEAIHFLKLSFSKQVKSIRVDQAPGVFWQKRYYDTNVRNHRQFVEKLRYIHQNPVRRGLCATAAEWKWSSFRHYAFREAGTVEIESEWIARDRESEKPSPAESRVFLVPG
ncbi:MAG TPA: transposase [Clostridia bacterium]|nr:transposase [Clostridia bacterium]